MTYMLDTNTVSYIIKGNIPSVRKRLLQIPMEEIFISCITQAELLFGLAKRPEATNLKVAVHEFLLRVDILPWDSETANHYALVRAALEKKGIPFGNLDMMIGSHALATKKILVTNDKIFKQIKHLSLENWAK